MDKDDIEITDLVIPGKKGPFTLHKLSWDDLFPALFEGGDDATPIMLRICQVSLCNGQGKPIYARGQVAKMKKDISGGELMALAGTAYKLNDVDKVLSAFSGQEQTAKN